MAIISDKSRSILYFLRNRTEKNYEKKTWSDIAARNKEVFHPIFKRWEMTLRGIFDSET